MKRNLILLMLALAATVAVLAQATQNFTVTLTAAQVRAVQASIVRQNNTNITTVTQHLQNVVDIDTAQRMAELRGLEIQPLRERWDSLSATQRSNVLNAAGIP